MESPVGNSLKGQLLMAMPSLMDPNFYQSVTLICEHTSTGALGVTVDRVSSTIFTKDIFEELKIPYIPEMEKIPIYHGGPVHIDEIFVLHGPPFNWTGCLMVTATIALSNTIDVLTAIAAGQGPENFLIFLGCAGWGEGQLESELMQNSWLTDAAEGKILFETPVEDRWRVALKRMGIDPELLSNMPGNA